MYFQAIVSSPFTWSTVKSVNKAFLLLLLLNKLKCQGSSGKDSCNLYVGQLMVFCLLFNFFHFVKFWEQVASFGSRQIIFILEVFQWRKNEFFLFFLSLPLGEGEEKKGCNLENMLHELNKWYKYFMTWANKTILKKRNTSLNS